jgi:hypothetical protein
MHDWLQAVDTTRPSQEQMMMSSFMSGFNRRSTILVAAVLALGCGGEPSLAPAVSAAEADILPHPGGTGLAPSIDVGRPLDFYPIGAPRSGSNMPGQGAPLVSAGMASQYASLLWQNTNTREGAMWVMNGGFVAASISLGTPPANWVLTAAGDFDLDQLDDLIWRNSSTGETVIWFMDGTAHVKGSISLGILSTDWRLVTAADQNADGRDDFLWQNTVTGRVAWWLMNGTQIVNTFDAGDIGPPWLIVGVASTNFLQGRANYTFVYNPNSDDYRYFEGSTFRGASLQPMSAFATWGWKLYPWKLLAIGQICSDSTEDTLWLDVVTNELEVKCSQNLSGPGTIGFIPAGWVLQSSYNDRR